MKSLLFKLATGRNILIFLVLYAAMIAFVMVPAQKFMEAHGGAGPLDLLQFYDANQALVLLASYDAEVRAFYQKIEYSADIVYPIIYTLFLGVLWLFLLKKAFAETHVARGFWFVPFLPIVFDLCENVCILVLLGQHPNFDRDTASITAVFSAIKWAFVYLTMILLVTGMLKWAVRRR